MIIPPHSSQPIVLKDGTMTLPFQSWAQLVSKTAVLQGAGNPEGVVEAEQGRLYMDTAGTAGSILYAKRDSQLSGDASQGWILV